MAIQSDDAVDCRAVARKDGVRRLREEGSSQATDVAIQSLMTIMVKN